MQHGNLSFLVGCYWQEVDKVTKLQPEAKAYGMGIGLTSPKQGIKGIV
jgi:hypothetical protein